MHNVSWANGIAFTSRRDCIYIQTPNTKHHAFSGSVELHRLRARVAVSESRLMHVITVWDVPGPTRMRSAGLSRFLSSDQRYHHPGGHDSGLALPSSELLANARVFDVGCTKGLTHTARQSAPSLLMNVYEHPFAGTCMCSATCQCSVPALYASLRSSFSYHADYLHVKLPTSTSAHPSSRCSDDFHSILQ
jgi:hypothetical protein